MAGSLVHDLHRHAVARPRRTALVVDGHAVDYATLARLGRGVAGWLLGLGGGPAGRVGILGGRSLGTYAGVVGACWAGGTYVPLGLSWPEERLAVTLGLTRLDALIVDADGAARLTGPVRAACPASILRLEPDAPPPDVPGLAPVDRPGGHVAYLIFTSGTTGRPKGVQVGLDAIAGHLAVMQDIYRFVPEDRVSLAFELTFDPSILNMFMTWNAGAALHVVPARLLYMPLGFIQEQALTVWNSAPTVVGMLMRLGALAPGSLPGLRISIFGGETLTVEAARAWQRAAPNSVVDNVYGPTEATIECLHQRLTDPPVVTKERGSVAIGRPYPGTEVAVLGPDGGFLPDGEAGELAVAGPQLAIGYLDDPALTAARFPRLGGRRWYLTGDAAYRDAAGCHHHLGRLDDQIKVRGHRVEPGDVEAHLRAASGAALVAVVAWPFAQGGAIGLVGFVVGPTAVEDAVLAELARRLPPYMVPQSIRTVASLPVTSHGKVDRAALVALLAAEAAGARTQDRSSAASPEK